MRTGRQPRFPSQAQYNMLPSMAGTHVTHTHTHTVSLTHARTPPSPPPPPQPTTAAFTVVHGIFNAISVKLLGFLSVVSVAFHVVGTLVIVIGLPIIATTRQSASWVFGHFQVGGRRRGPALLLACMACVFTPPCPPPCSGPCPLAHPPHHHPSPTTPPSTRHPTTPQPPQNYGNDPEFMGDAVTGVGNPFYSFLLGLLLCQWAMVGYDSSAHIAKETKNAAVAGPLGLIMAM